MGRQQQHHPALPAGKPELFPVQPARLLGLVGLWQRGFPDQRRAATLRGARDGGAVDGGQGAEVRALGIPTSSSRRKPGPIHATLTDLGSKLALSFPGQSLWVPAFAGMTILDGTAPKKT